MLYLFLLIGSITGTLSGLLGIGGGIIVVPSLAWIFAHYHMAPDCYIQFAAGSSLAGIMFISLTSAFAHHRHGNVEWPIFKQLAPAMMIGASIGVATAGYLPTRVLSLLFGLFMLVLSVRMFLSATRRSNKPTLLPANKKLRLIGFCVGIQSGLLGTGGNAFIVPFFARCNVPMHKATGTSVTASFPLATSATLTSLVSHHSTGATASLPWSTGYVYWPAALSIAIASIIFCTTWC